MKRWAVVACALVAVLAFSGPAYGAGTSKHGLELYTATVDHATAAELVSAGYDVAAVRRGVAGVQVDLVLSRAERGKLAREGISVRAKRDKKGRTQSQRAAFQSLNGFTVWRSWDERGGIRDEMRSLAARHPQLLKLVVLGRSIEGREILALKLTQGARGRADGTRPAVLYSATQHAREWISTEVNRRLLRWYVDRWLANDKAIRNLLKNRELWFVHVANPDGYQHTFDVERLWRKNLRDNDGDGQITNADGVDPNRNFPENWNYDQEGSSSLFSSETYRGTGPASEPETQALMSLYDRVDFAFHVNYHSYGQLLLYPAGWQVQTLTGDNPIYEVLTGNDANPAVPGFDPDLSAELYTTNGETTDWAHNARGTLAWTPELSEGCPGCGFVFPDDAALVQAEFKKNLSFALDVARSAADPDDPVSHLGNETEPFYLEQVSLDPEKANNPLADLRFDVSFGDPQPVAVLAKRSLGTVMLKYRVDGGAVQSAPTSEWEGGERFGGPGDVYYRYLRGEVTGTSPGDSVEVWFEGGGQTSKSFTYQAVSESGNRALVMAAEDYTGAQTLGPGCAVPPCYLDYYTDALAANGVSHDVYDIDAQGRKAPDDLGVLSHYDAVVWYTGDDLITREPGMGPGNASRLANDEMLNVRAYMNEGGRLLFTGKGAGHQYYTVHGSQFYDPIANLPCTGPVAARCLPLSDDFIQYNLGAYITNVDAGFDDDGNMNDVNGVAVPYDSLRFGFNGADSAQNQNHNASFLATSGILPPDQYPLFDSWPSLKYDREGGPFDPHTGEHYMYSQIADITYKRLTRTIDVPTGGGDLSFWTSYDTEGHWDFLFVEARTPGGEDWTTLPDQNGHTSQDTGDSCAAGWHELHPHLERYQGADCSGTGSTGVWHATSGNSGGWQQWSVSLDEWAGAQVEISIAYVSDWSVQGLGVFVDDVVTPTGTGSTSFETGLDGWEVSGPPPGSSANPNDWTRTTSEGFPEGAAITTVDSIYFGFGFEGINGAATRNEVMRRAMDYLLAP